MGVMMLLANNPRPGTPQLPFRRLYAWIPRLALIAAACGALGGLAGWAGLFAGQFEDVVRAELWRPERFMAVWGIHLGGYVGALVGACLGVVSILRCRRSLRSAP